MGRVCMIQPCSHISITSLCAHIVLEYSSTHLASCEVLLHDVCSFISTTMHLGV